MSQNNAQRPKNWNHQYKGKWQHEGKRGDLLGVLTHQESELSAAGEGGELSSEVGEVELLEGGGEGEEEG